MPVAIGSGLKGWLRQGNGLLLLALSLLGWFGLLTWALPVAIGTTGSVTTHVMGREPGLAADFLLQSFGVGAAFFFAVPTFWGVEQLARRRLGRPLLRLLIWPMATLAVAGALSALPSPPSWPFARGLGGVLGDQLYSVVKMAIAQCGFGATGLAAGSVLALAGATLFVCVVGASEGDAQLGKAAVPEPRFEPAPHPNSRPRSERAVTPKPVREPYFAPDTHLSPEPAVEDVRMPSFEPAWRLEVAAEDRLPAFLQSPGESRIEPDPVPDTQRPIHVPYDDFPEEDDESRMMAQRFAPNGLRRQATSQAPVWGWSFLGRSSDAELTKTEPVLHPEPIPQPPNAPEPQRYADVQSANPPAREAQEAVGAAARLLADTPLPYRVPPISLLARSAIAEDVPPDNRVLLARSRRLEEVLAEFGVRCEVIGVAPGPNVTQFEIETAAGVKATRVIGLAEDVARTMGLSSARIVGLPGRASIIIELPNEQHTAISLRELLETQACRQTVCALPFLAGLANDRQPIVTDLAALPGMLVAGRPASGKSTALQALLASLLLRFAPSDLRLLVADPNGAGHARFDGIAHLLAPVITEPSRALAALQWCVVEMDERLKMMAKLGLRGFATYNNAVRNAARQGHDFKRMVHTGFSPESGRPMYEQEIIPAKSIPYIVAVIDDLDIMLKTHGEEIDAIFHRLDQSGRTAGIHIVAATGRIDRATASPGLRTALQARVCFKLENKTESRAAIGAGGAEMLLGAGDFLLSLGGTPVRGQAPGVSDGDVAKLVAAVRAQAKPAYEPLLARYLSAAPALERVAVAAVETDGATDPDVVRDMRGRPRVIVGRAASA